MFIVWCIILFLIAVIVTAVADYLGTIDRIQFKRASRIRHRRAMEEFDERR